MPKTNYRVTIKGFKDRDIGDFTLDVWAYTEGGAQNIVGKSFERRYEFFPPDDHFRIEILAPIS